MSRQTQLLLIIVASTALAGCNNSVRIVSDGATNLCRMADRPGGGTDLIVRLQSPPSLNKPAMGMSVTFSGNTTIGATTPPIPGNSTVDVRVPVPASCFRPDCGFLIKVQDPAGAVQAQGSCVG